MSHSKKAGNFLIQPLPASIKIRVFKTIEDILKNEEVTISSKIADKGKDSKFNS